MTAEHEGSAGFLSSIMGFHMNALAALLVVVGLIVLCLFLAERLKRVAPRFLHKEPDTQRSLAVLDVIPLDPKRRLTSVSVRAPSGKKALAVIMTGGPSDLCLGWLEEDEKSCPSHAETVAANIADLPEKKEPSRDD